MKRRDFLLAAAAALQSKQPSILVHEHILVDFIGADLVKPGRYDRDAVLRVAKPKLQQLKQTGCQRMQECTPNYLGRDPELLARLSGEVGLEIWSNTGLYGAGNHKYVPAFARQETAAQLATRWIQESQQSWKPRFIKIGVNLGPLDELDRKLVRAAAITSRETGLTIASHTGNGKAALEQVQIVAEEKVNPSKFVWVHAQNEHDQTIHERVARSDAWVEFDGIGPKTIAAHLRYVQSLASKNLLGRTLISQDSGWYHVGETNGGDYRGYTFLYTHFLPHLEPEQIPILMWENPRKAFGT